MGVLYATENRQNTRKETHTHTFKCVFNAMENRQTYTHTHTQMYVSIYYKKSVVAWNGSNLLLRNHFYNTSTFQSYTV